MTSHFREVFSINGRRSPDRASSLFTTPSNTVPHEVQNIRVVVERSFLGTFSIGNVESSGHDTFVTEPLDATVVVPFRGKITSVPAGGSTQEALPGEALLFSPNRRATRVEPSGTREFVGIPLMVPLWELRRTALELGASRSRVRALDAFSLSGAARIAPEVADLVDLALSLREGLKRGDETLLKSDVQRSLSTALSEMFVGFLHSTETLRLPDHSDPSSAYRHVRKAIEYMREHYSEITAISQVAMACGISSRTLEAAFRDVWSVRPHSFLVAIRLEAFRRLILSSGNDLSITSAALAVGFSHLGRFSTQYRRRYGENPSDTLGGLNSRSSAGLN